MNRGKVNADLPEELKTINANINNKHEEVKALKEHTYDVVVNFIAFTPEDVKQDTEIFKGKL